MRLADVATELVENGHSTDNGNSPVSEKSEIFDNLTMREYSEDQPRAANGEWGEGEASRDVLTKTHSSGATITITSHSGQNPTAHMNGKEIGRGNLTPLSKPVTSGGKEYTHVIGPVALTKSEADTVRAGIRQHQTDLSRSAVAKADRVSALQSQMDKSGRGDINVLTGATKRD